MLAAFPEGEKVKLEETPKGSTFAGWSGGGCSGTATTCEVTMSAATEVKAEFTVLPTFLLTVSKTGTGEDSHVNTRRINSGTECSQHSRKAKK